MSVATEAHTAPAGSAAVPPLSPQASVDAVQPRLRVHGLRHSFGELRVLDGLELAVAPGEIFGLLGPNGSGKSTTLRVLTGMLVPDEGVIELDGARVEPGGRPLRQRMGVVFQSGSLDARMTARENLAMSAALYGISSKLAATRIDELLAFTALTDRAGDAVGDFSGGMRRRLELSRALLHEPSLLLLDEPTTGLDERFFRQTWERIEALRASRGLTVLLTTHRSEEAERCDRVAVVDRGRVIALDTPDNLRQRVSGDVLTLEADAPDALAAELSARFALEARVVEGRVVLERERGHELIPRLVESLPAGRLHSLSMHRPNLADVFVKLTGRSLADEDLPAAVPGKAGAKAVSKAAGKVSAG
jgi:ABC-2 type transport system ATP-binding protein